MKPRILAEAEAEMLEAACWYEDRREQLGLEFHESILETIRQIGESPERFPTYEVAPSDRNVHRALVDRFPYVVIFEVRDSEILVIAIAHTSRASHFWHDR